MRNPQTDNENMTDPLPCSTDDPRWRNRQTHVEGTAASRSCSARDPRWLNTQNNNDNSTVSQLYRIPAVVISPAIKTGLSDPCRSHQPCHQDRTVSRCLVTQCMLYGTMSRNYKVPPVHPSQLLRTTFTGLIEDILTDIIFKRKHSTSNIGQDQKSSRSNDEL
ncbi:hypothetical protein J6590_000333 [Homalodisca vitripennis]|nr:hypothetical protein J6590_000333 [Homalodisca vitripennis]